MPLSHSIDLFCHYLPPAYVAAVERNLAQPLLMFRRACSLPGMVDLDARLNMMRAHPGYQQVLSLASPPLEVFPLPVASDLARLANDEMAALTRRHPDAFPGFVASVPMHDPDAAAAETRRALDELGAAGVQFFTNIKGQPLDYNALAPVLDLLAEGGHPLWLHPARSGDRPDYLGEEYSKYELWWLFGWPYETTLAMARMVFEGVFQRWPSLNVITHHVGGMLPMMEGRLRHGLSEMGRRTPPDRSDALPVPLDQPAVDAFRIFYADTASFGWAPAIECGLAYFGPEKMLFASDMPFGSSQGAGLIGRTLNAIDALEIDAATRTQILAGNARRLLGSRLAAHQTLQPQALTLG